MSDDARSGDDVVDAEIVSVATESVCEPATCVVGAARGGAPQEKSLASIDPKYPPPTLLTHGIDDLRGPPRMDAGAPETPGSAQVTVAPSARDEFRPYGEVVPVAGIKSGGLELSPRKKALDKQLERIAALDNKLRLKVSQIVTYAMDASEIDDESPQPEGWSARRYRIAKDGRKTEKTAPAYLKMARAVKESYVRAEADKKPAPELNAKVIVYAPTQVFNYPVRDVSDPEEKP